MTKRERIEKYLELPDREIITPWSITSEQVQNAQHDLDQTWLKWRAQLIEKLFCFSVEVTGDSIDFNKPITWRSGNHPHHKFDAFTALLFDPQPVRQGVSKKEILHALRHSDVETCMKIANLIEYEGILP